VRRGRAYPRKAFQKSGARWLGWPPEKPGGPLSHQALIEIWGGPPGMRLPRPKPLCLLGGPPTPIGRPAGRGRPRGKGAAQLTVISGPAGNPCVLRRPLMVIRKGDPLYPVGQGRGRGQKFAGMAGSGIWPSRPGGDLPRSRVGAAENWAKGSATPHPSSTTRFGGREPLRTPRRVYGPAPLRAWFRYRTVSEIPPPCTTRARKAWRFRSAAVMRCYRW